jgi:predicted DNA-binding protein
MEIRLSPEQEARLAAISADTGRSTDDLVRDAVALWEEQQRGQISLPKHSPVEAAARLRELRKGNFLPEGETLEELVNHGRA